MRKFQLLFSILFILAFQVAYSSSETGMEEVSIALGIESENQLHFEPNHFSPNILGEVGSGQGSIIVYVPETKCFLSNSKSDDLQIGITQSILQTKTTLRTILYFGAATYCILIIPLYLQTGNLQI